MASATSIDINKVSAAVLAEAAGIRPHVAGAIVNYRDEHGAFADLASVTEVPGVGATTYQRLRKVVAEIGADEPEFVEETPVAEALEEIAEIQEIEAVEAEAEAAVVDVVETLDVAAPANVEPVEEPAPAKVEAPAAFAAAPVAAKPVASEPVTATDEGRQFAALWVDLGKEQVAHNITTMQAMAGCRSWPEAVNLQQRYVYESYERMTKVMSHYAKFAGSYVPKGIRLG